MRKLKLTIEDLEISTFSTSRAPRGRGTVVGHKPPAPTALHCEDTYVGYWTCDFTCDATSVQPCLSQQTFECGGCQP